MNEQTKRTDKKGRRTTMKRALVLMSAVVTVLALSWAVGQAPAPAQPKRIVWKVQTTWTSGMTLYKHAVEIGERVKEMSGGRLEWEVLSAGAIVGAFETLDAVQRGVVDAVHGWPGYWTGKNTAAALFGGTLGGPFGMRVEDLITWLYAGGGNDLYNEFLQKDLKMSDVIAFLHPVTFQEPLGWFRKPIGSLKDFRGIKMRSSGLGVDLLKEMGISAVVLPGGEILPALERGVIDAAEWSNPATDIPLGFHNVAKHLVMPSFRQPIAANELLINRKKWEELPPDLRGIVRNAVLAQIPIAMAKEYWENAKLFHELEPKYGVRVMNTPPDVIEAEIKAIDKVLQEHSQKNPVFARVLTHMKEFAAKEIVFHDRIRPPHSKLVEHYFGRK
jgi:TRAP-type mannitol/chloroaromatic compound transport system substrate-binding protein